MLSINFKFIHIESEYYFLKITPKNIAVAIDPTNEDTTAVIVSRK
jgi:hypothetical protein